LKTLASHGKGIVRTELERLEEQLRSSFEGGSWHGPSVRETLDGVTAEEAWRHPIPGAHSIWELVLHLAGTYSLVLRRLNGDVMDLSPDEDWPVVEAPTPVNWTAALNVLRSLNQQLRAAVRHFNLETLDEPLGNPKYSAYEQFVGVTQHDLYHAGQIVLLRRALRAAAAASAPAPASPPRLSSS
jgi:uncharacterized damage-inducible protein DinB